MESLGATLNASSGSSGFTSNVAASGLTENFDQTLDIFADLIRNPQFSAEEFEKLKTRTLNQMQFQRTIPGLIAQERLQRAAYREHPASVIFPPADALKRMTADDLKKFYQAYYRPNNAILAVTGAITMKQLMPKLEKMFGDWQKADVPSTQIPAVQDLSKAGIYLIDRPNSVQTTLLLGSLGIDRKHPDYYALQVLNEVFGGSPAARLFMNLREDKGYTYGASSNVSSSKYPGLVFASSSVRTEVTEGALKEFMYEIKRIREEKVPAGELENAKRSLIGSFALSLEQPPVLLSNMLTLRLYDFPDSYWDAYPQKIMAVTSEDIQRVAQKYYDPSRLQIIAVGDAGKIREALGKYGTVEMYDTEGKLVASTTKAQ
jgi:predicted Zn-dependent peptidase